MYSPEEELEHAHVRIPLKDKQAVATKHDFANQTLFGGMQAFLSKKSQDFTDNITGFVRKLDETERRLKISQDRIEKEAEDERRAQAAKEEFGYKMTQAIHKLNNDNVDREGLSRSSGSRTATTRGSDSDLESSFSAKHEAKVNELRQIKKAYEDVATT